MRKLTSFLAFIFAATACFAGVTISSPGSGATVGSPVHFVASASGSTTIASMILYVDGTKYSTVYSNNLDTYVSLTNGSHYVQINSWDNNGNIYKASENIYVSGSSSTSTSTNTSTSGAWVNLTSPSNGASVGSPVTVTANGGSANGISGWVVYVDDANAYQVNNNSNSLSASVNIGSGTHTLYVRAWDRSNGTYGTSSKISLSVGGSTSSSGSTGGSTVTAGTPIYNIEQMSGWGSCSACAGAGGNGPVAGYSMTPGVGSPSLDGKSAQFSIWGDTPYSDVLWWKSLSSIIGDTSKPHHFIYDGYFYLNNPSVAQALEFDINQFVNGHSLIFGTQCNLLNGHVWDVWDNRNNRWVHTSKYCGTPSANTWHHFTIEVERASDGGDWLHYVSITLDGNKTYLDAWYPPASTSWTGVTVNVQMDGNYQMADYSMWLDKLTLSYW